MKIQSRACECSEIVRCQENGHDLDSDGFGSKVRSQQPLPRHPFVPLSGLRLEQCPCSFPVCPSLRNHSGEGQVGTDCEELDHPPPSSLLSTAGKTEGYTSRHNLSDRFCLRTAVSTAERLRVTVPTCPVWMHLYFSHSHLRFAFGGLLSSGHWSTAPAPQTAGNAWEFTSPGGPLINGRQVSRYPSPDPLGHS